MAGVRWNERELRQLLESRDGPVGRDLVAKGERVAAEQRRTCPVSEDGHHGHPPGTTRDSVKSTMGADAIGLHVDVGPDAETQDGIKIGLLIDLGTKPHVIRSKGDYPLRSAKGEVFGKEVQHPGTESNPFIRRSLDVLRNE